MVVVPAATAVTMPLLFTVATDALEELQVTCVLISRLVPSEYVQVAVNCWVAPTALVAVVGDTPTEDNVTAAGTVRVLLSDIPPREAVMVVVPAATAVTMPLLFTVATDVLDEVQVACEHISRLVPSEYEPVAVNCWVLPAGTFALSGVSVIEAKVASVTVRVVVPDILPEEAAMVVVPGLTPVASPLLLTVAVAVLEELQVTCVVISRLVPSE
jgi:hypothetical protein